MLVEASLNSFLIDETEAVLPCYGNIIKTFLQLIQSMSICLYFRNRTAPATASKCPVVLEESFEAGGSKFLLSRKE
jgi:hypothetical protein